MSIFVPLKSYSYYNNASEKLSWLLFCIERGRNWHILTLAIYFDLLFSCQNTFPVWWIQRIPIHFLNKNYVDNSLPPLLLSVTHSLFCILILSDNRISFLFLHHKHIIASLLRDNSAEITRFSQVTEVTDYHHHPLLLITRYIYILKYGGKRTRAAPLHFPGICIFFSTA